MQSHSKEKGKYVMICNEISCARDWAQLNFPSLTFEIRCGWMPGSRPGKFLKWTTNARQSEIFTEFPVKDSLRLLDGIWCFFRNVDRFQKLCSLARWPNIRAWGYYKIGMCLTLKFTLISSKRYLSNCDNELLSNLIRRCKVSLE